MEKIEINLRDQEFIEQAITNNKIFFKDMADLRNFISIFCDLVSEPSIISRRKRFLASKIVVVSRFGLRINPVIVEQIKKEMELRKEVMK